MKPSAPLKRPLIFFPLAVHLVTLLVSFAVLLSVAIRFDSGGSFTDEQITRVIADAIGRDDDGHLEIGMTPELTELQAGSPDLWFVAEDATGANVVFGRVPDHYASLIGRLGDLSYAQLRAREHPYELSAVIRRQSSSIGTLTVLGHGKLTELSLTVLMASSVVILPIFLLLVLSSLLVTPWTIRRSLAGVSRVAMEASQIDTGRRGRRLSEAHVPAELTPLVKAVNEALRRLDEGYERQRRFIASAAHELRTPIAVLRAKVDATESADVRRLAADVQRLATLTEQLLDLQRLDRGVQEETLDLAAIVRGVVADLAPLVIASGRTIEVLVHDKRPCLGDAAAMERVVTNLIQNAIEHGGRHVTIRVMGAAFEVEDDGPGVPLEQRERVFEPFHRLRPRSTGSGLGLSLVQQVVERHGGQVSILDGKSGGTCVRVALGHD